MKAAHASKVPNKISLNTVFVLVCFFIKNVNSTENQTAIFFDTPDVTKFVIENDEQIQLEAFKYSTNDDILKRNNASEFGRLKWVSLGYPKIVKTPSLQNATTSEIFHFTDDGFFTYVQMLTEKQQKVLVDGIREKYKINVTINQIVDLIATNFRCSLNSGFKTIKISIIGKVKDFRSFPLKVHFLADINSNERIEFQKLIKHHLEKDIDLSLTCEISSSKNSETKEFTATTKEVSVLEIKQKLFGSLNSTHVTPEQLKNLAKEFYLTLNFEHELNIEQFSKLFLDQLINQTGAQLEQISLEKAKLSLSNYSMENQLKVKDGIISNAINVLKLDKNLLSKNLKFQLKKRVAPLFKRIFTLYTTKDFKTNQNNSELNKRKGLSSFEIDDDLIQIINKFQNQFDELKASAGNALSELGSKVSYIEKNGNAMADTIEKIQSELNEYKNLADSAIDTLNELNERVSENEKKDDLVGETIKNIQDELSEYKKFGESAVDTLNDLKKRVSNNEANDNSVAITINKIQNEFNEYKKAGESIVEELDALKKKISNMEINGNAVIDAINKIQNELNEYKNSGNSAVDTLNDLKQRVSVIEKKGDSLIDSIEKIQNESNEYKKLGESAVAALNDIKKRLSDIEMNDNLLANMIDKIQSEQNELRNLSGSAVDYLSSFEKRVSDIETKGKSLAETVNRIQSEMNEYEKAGNSAVDALNELKQRLINNENTAADTVNKIQNEIKDLKSAIETNGVRSDLKAIYYAVNSIMNELDFYIKRDNNRQYVLKKRFDKLTSGTLVSLPNGDLASGSDDGIKIWNLNDGTLKKTFADQTSKIRSMIILSNGDLASVSGDKIINIWDTNDGTVKRALVGHDSYINTLVSSRCGDLASGSDDKTIKIWDKNDGTVKRTLVGHTSSIFSLVSFSNCDIASGSADNSIKIWNTNDGTLKGTLIGHTSYIKSLAILPNGDLASGSDDKTIKIWNTIDGTVKRTLTGHKYEVCSLVILPNGDLASGSVDETIKIWNTNDGTEKQSLDARYGPVWNLVVRPNGEFVSGSAFGTFRVWTWSDKNF